MARLRLVPVNGEPIEVTRDQSLVGREPNCEIVVTDGSVSRRHARLERRGATWFVVDQGSANGTYVNSLKVAEYALKNGQELRFGALAFRVDIVEDPEATVATPILPEQTLMAAATPPPPPVAPPPIPPVPASPTPRGVSATPPPRAASAPPPPPSAAAARDRFRPAGAPPVPPMAGGAPPAKKGKGPLFWIAVGCCGCVLLVALLAGVFGGGAYFMSKGAADAAHGWLGEVRKGQLDEAYAGGLSAEYKTQLSREDFERLAARLGKYGDATFWQRSIDNDRAVLKGVLTAKGGPPQPITLKLVKEGGAWKVDEVDFGVDR